MSGPAPAAATLDASRIRDFNDELLESAGSSRDDFTPFYEKWLQSPRAPEFLDRAVLLLEEELKTTDLVVLSDPSMCRLMPFWTEALRRTGCNPSAVIVTRAPAEVGRSAGTTRSRNEPLSQMIWLRYMLAAELETRGIRRLFTGFDELTKGWQGVVAKAQDALGLVWPKSVASVEFDVAAVLDQARAQEAAPSSAAAAFLPPWLHETSDILSRWVEQGENPSDFSALDRIKSEFDVAASAFARVVRGAHAYDPQSMAEAPQHQTIEARVARTAPEGAPDRDTSTLKGMLQEQRRKATLLNADLHAQIEARETLEAQLIEAQAELEASRARRKEMARVITNRDAKIERLYQELAALQLHMVRSSPSGQMKAAFRRVGRALRRPARQTA